MASSWSCNCMLESATDYKSPKTNLPPVYHELMLMLRDKLQSTGDISRIEYVGSAFKKTRIDQSDMDNLFIKRDFEIKATPSTQWGECAFLEDSTGKRIDPVDTLWQFKGKVQRIINGSEYDTRVKLADHGPAIELRYSHGGTQFNVDLVFSYEISENVMYTAKPPKDAQGADRQLWKTSTALDEKMKMLTIDKDNKSSRWAVRILKALIHKEATLQVLTSYVIEQALYHVHDQYPDSFWVEANLKEIVKSLLIFTSEAVRRDQLSNKFNPLERNIIPQMSDITRSNVADRLMRLSREPLLTKLMENV